MSAHGWQILLVLFLGLNSGCGVIGSTREAKFPVPADDANQIQRLQNARSLADIDSILADIVPQRLGQANVERLIGGWGKYGSWYDLAVVRYLWEHWPGAYETWSDIDAARLIPLVAARIREQHDLLRQVFWYVNWRSSKVEFQDLCRLCESPGRGCVHVDGDLFRVDLYVAGALEDPWLVRCDSPQSADDAWQFVRFAFLTNRPFLRYNAERGTYVLDEDAKREGRYLSAAEQRLEVPHSPLPDWDSAVIPERPVHAGELEPADALEPDGDASTTADATE